MEYIRNIGPISTRGGLPGGHNPLGRARSPRRALVGCALLGAPPGAARPTGGLLVHKKSTKSFGVFGLRLKLISCDVKNKQKIATGTGHWVNRLVPKNDIKLL